MKINEVLDQMGKDILSEETKKLLSTAFDEAIQAQVTERLELEVKDALQKLDEEHATQLGTLLETIDADHTAKLQAILTKIDEDHTQKLEYYINRSKKLIEEDAAEFKGQLVKQISNYLDLYLEDAIPKKELAEAVQNKQAQKILDEIKQVVAVDEKFINDTIREAVEDGRRQIDLLKSELNEAIKQNIRINQEAKSVRADLLVEKMTTRFSNEKKEAVMRVLKGKDPDYITENFDYVVKMFDKEQAENQDLLAEESKKHSKVFTNKVDLPKSKVRDTELVTEQTGQNEEGSQVTGYLSTLKQQDNVK